MILDYYVLDPTGNVTILVETPLPPDRQPEAAARLMELEGAAEQVGFISRDGLSDREKVDLTLRMAGGEFCGNASMCAAVLAAVRTGRRGTFHLRVSGAPAPICVEVAEEAAGSFCGTVQMPLPVRIDRGDRSGGSVKTSSTDLGACPVVFFDGIAHIIIEETFSREAAQALAPLWCRRLAADAVGLMFLDRSRGTLTPLVYVPGAGTLCWENSCASGTTAVGAWLAARTQRPVSLSLRQPGGTLKIDAAPGGPLLLTGSVRLVKYARTDVDLP